MAFRNLRRIPATCLLSWVLVNGCSVKEVRLGDMVDGGGVFTPTDEAGADVPTVPLLCVGTQCPLPFATCNTAGMPTYTCGTDLSRDHENCGACGQSCGDFKVLNMTSKCVDGACRFDCWTDTQSQIKQEWRNCNGVIDDGCEVDVWRDVNNCGACGNVCPAGKGCNDGVCGCPADKKECPFVLGRTRCVDIENDDANCGDCGTVCDDVGACALDTMYYGCVNKTCGVLKCKPRMADCNNDVGTLGCASDGCEVGAGPDLDNCGGCNIKCKAGEECRDTQDGFACASTCPSQNLTYCALQNTCMDLLNDVMACGRCENTCPSGGPNQVRACKKGICALECAPGFADCNQDAVDGCETDLNINPNNCGACGNRCDLALGQPCVQGKCLMAPCGDPGTK